VIRNGTLEHFGRRGLTYFVMTAPGFTHRSHNGVFVVKQEIPQAVYPFHTFALTGTTSGGPWRGY
jgi:hypothetical protein